MTIKEFFLKARNRIDARLLIPLLANSRQKKLKTTEFTIISNNCWGGRCYEYFNLQKQTPTVGAYFYAEQYVKFCKNLKYYLGLEMRIIPTIESKYYSHLLTIGKEDAIVGVLDDIELFFLHYSDPRIVLEKWKRRVERIHWDRIILKFSYQNLCNDELIREFMQIKQYPKFCLVGEKITGAEDEIIFSRADGKVTISETDNFDMYLDIIDIINDRLQ